MTTEAAPRWQWQRAEWSKVTDGIHARRRAKARAAYNRFRQEQALRRRRALWACINRLSDGGRRPVRAVDVWRAFQQEWVCCVRTFWEDWRWLKEHEWSFPSRALQRAERLTAAQSQSQAATHRSLWLTRFAALATAVARYCSPEQQHAVLRLAAQLVEQWTPLPRAGAVFDGREAFVPVVPGAGPVPASPAHRHTGASAPTSTSTSTPTPTPPAAFPSSDALRAGRPVAFSGAPGTAARLVRQRPPTPREWEWWEL